MTPTELMDFVYSWINKVINTDAIPARDLKIIEEYQSAPRPDLPYLTISNPFGFHPIGRATKGGIKVNDSGIPIDEEGDPIAPGENGVQEMVQDFQATITLKEIGSRNESTGVPNGGDGRFLQELLMSIEKEEIQQLGATNQVAFLTELGISASPEERGGEWDLIEMLDIQFGFAVKATERLSWIDTVDWDYTFE
jgi:hypothetical protein